MASLAAVRLPAVSDQLPPPRPALAWAEASGAAPAPRPPSHPRRARGRPSAGGWIQRPPLCRPPGGHARATPGSDVLVRGRIRRPPGLRPPEPPAPLAFIEALARGGHGDLRSSPRQRHAWLARSGGVHGARAVAQNGVGRQLGSERPHELHRGDLRPLRDLFGAPRRGDLRPLRDLPGALRGGHGTPSGQRHRGRGRAGPHLAGQRTPHQRAPPAQRAAPPRRPQEDPVPHGPEPARRRTGRAACTAAGGGARAVPPQHGWQVAVGEGQRVSAPRGH
ncbi:unnamed protein product [Prorocentrum cordatum]|uniref:Uncharacterized protein n=1 Tax=Prorocentrum cordatum TaxID=2364126 RepID=A0ABN9TSH2_9DINO|nr:unnamed protein product [Polarella glacialis]